ncbi:MAG TPA: hypothetical protein VGD77_04885 [Gemmatimonadaceae bacterium]
MTAHEAGRAGTYPVTFAVLVGALVLAGALALSLMITGSPAFPVHVFGDPRTSDRLEAAEAIRPSERPALPRGHMGPQQLLPLPVMPVWHDAPGSTTDTLYTAAARAGVQRELDLARAAAQRGDRPLATRLYANLAGRLTGNRALLIERASVLAAFGAHRDALALLRLWLPQFPGDYELRMLAARNAWWSEQALTADSLVGQALALRRGDGDALRLRETIRSTTQPPLAIARAWVAEAPAGNDGRAQVALARALVRDGAFGEALAHFQAALRTPALHTDSLLLEAASTAAAADSVRALEAFTEQYLAFHPHDAPAVLQVARSYAWRGDYADALRNYQRLAWTDPALRLEVAQVLLWSGDQPGAERELRAVVAAQPRQAVALKLLGDLALWRGDWTTASTAYARAYAVDPSVDGLAEGIASAARGMEAARLASLGRPALDGYGATLEAFGDNQRFRWLTLGATRAFTGAGAAFSATVRQHVMEGSPTGALSRNPGASARLTAAFDLRDRVRLDLLGGVERFGAVGSFGVFGGGVTLTPTPRTQYAVEFRHEPAAPRVATFSALQARATSDVLAVSAAATRGGWSGAVRGERERVASTVGSAYRSGVNASVTRALSPRLAASLGLSAQAVDRASPVLPGWGPVMWAPESYVEPTVGLSWRAPVTSAWSAEAGVQLGYGLVKERAGLQRFTGTGIPTGALSGDLRYQQGQWSVSAGASYGGALRKGYRSGTLRAQATYRLGR